MSKTKVVSKNTQNSPKKVQKVAPEYLILFGNINLINLPSETPIYRYEWVLG